MTDSLSMMRTLERDTEERLSVRKRDLEAMKAGHIRVLQTDENGERDLTPAWIERLKEWLVSDEAMLEQLRKR